MNPRLSLDEAKHRIGPLIEFTKTVNATHEVHMRRSWYDYFDTNYNNPADFDA